MQGVTPEAKKQKMHPTQVHILAAILTIKSGKHAQNGIYVGCGSV